jgi:hypothetical protein
MHVFHTLGAPPNNGSIILATNGCTQNNSAALKNSVTPNNQGKLRWATGLGCILAGVGILEPGVVATKIGGQPRQGRTGGGENFGLGAGRLSGAK